MAAKKATVLLHTPPGVARFPRLNEADTKFKAEGEYSVKLGWKPEVIEPTIKKLQKMFDERYAEECKLATEERIKKAGPGKKVAPVVLKKATDGWPFKEEEDKETGEKTGFVVANFKATASGISKKTGKRWTFKPLIVDAALRPTDVAIWGGSELVPSFEPFFWYTAALGFGLTLKLKGVQIIKLVQGGGARDAASLGFTAQEGYESVADEDTTSDDNTNEGNNTDGGDEPTDPTNF